MERSIKNKVVVITGGAQGIGYAIANSFLKNGAQVTILLDINEELGKAAAKTLQATYGTGKAEFIKCDITTDLDSASDQIFKKYGAVDVLVNNAGIINEVQWKKALDVNVASVIGWSWKFWEHMNKNQGGNGGTILNISSTAAVLIVRYFPVYVATKFAVLGFTKTLGHEDNFKQSGVRVFALNPGLTETSLTRFTSNLSYHEDVNGGIEEFMAKLPLQKPDAVGDAAVDVFEKAESGTAWLIEEGRPITQVQTSNYEF